MGAEKEQSLFQVSLSQAGLGEESGKKFALPPSTSHLSLLELVYSFRSDLKGENIAFFLNKSLIQSSLLNEAKIQKLGSEDLLEIEYAVASYMPKTKNIFPNIEWISALKILDGIVISGLYDGKMNFWDLKTNQLINCKDLTHAIHSIDVFKLNNAKYLISGHEDGSISIFGSNENKDFYEKEILVNNFVPHKLPVSKIQSFPDAGVVLSASYDQTTKLFKFNANNTESPLTELFTSKMHSQPVMDALFVKNGSSYLSGSLDGKLLQVDVEKFWETSAEFNLNSEIFSLCCLDYESNSPTVLAGCADNKIKLIDTRSNESLLFRNSFTSHTNIVSCLANDPLHKSNSFFSAGYDKILKHWDMRSPSVPLHDIRDHGGRILSLDTEEWILCSGATDGNLNIYNRSKK
ncbi:MAG: WD repeat-containing protein 12 [Paramarteilia canceri]